MTNEEIYKPKTICAVDIPGNELEYVLSKSKLGEALDEARKDEAVEFALFLFDFKPNPETNGWIKHEFNVLMEFSTEELYQLFKNKS